MSLLAILAKRPLTFATCLRSPTNLAALSRGPRDGWGVATTRGSDGLWTIERRAGSAAGHELFAAGSTSERGGERREVAEGVALVGHVHLRTVGAELRPSTPPFRRGRWVFAHTGVIDDLAFVKSRTSPERRQQCEAETDGELLFAFLLTRLDERNLADRVAPDQVDAVMTDATRELATHAIASFVLSDGHTLYAHRLGRALHVLERADLCALIVASEPLTRDGSDVWSALDDGALVRCHRDGLGSTLDLRFLAGGDRERVSDIELPFTD